MFPTPPLTSDTKFFLTKKKKKQIFVLCVCLTKAPFCLSCGEVGVAGPRATVYMAPMAQMYAGTRLALSSVSAGPSTSNSVVHC